MLRNKLYFLGGGCQSGNLRQLGSPRGPIKPTCEHAEESGATERQSGATERLLV